MVEIEASPLRYYYSVIQQSSLAICVKIHFCEKIWFKKNILLLSFFACSMKVWLPCNVVVKLFLALLLVEHGFPFFMKLLLFFFSYLGDHLLTIFKLCFIILDRDGFHFNDSLLYEAIHCKWRH